MSTSAPAPALASSTAPAPALETAPLPTDNSVITTNQDLQALVQSLKSTDPAERRRAASTINAMGTEAKDAVPALRDALKDTDSEVQAWSALALIHNNIYDKATVPILLQLLHHENPIMRQVAGLSLALIPYEESEKPPVIAALTQSVNQDDNADVRAAAASALKAILPENVAAPVGAK
jgi:HEAT repeat protein